MLFTMALPAANAIFSTIDGMDRRKMGPTTERLMLTDLMENANGSSFCVNDLIAKARMTM